MGTLDEAKDAVDHTIAKRHAEKTIFKVAEKVPRYAGISQRSRESKGCLQGVK